MVPKTLPILQVQDGLIPPNSWGRKGRIMVLEDKPYVCGTAMRIFLLAFFTILLLSACQTPPGPAPTAAPDMCGLDMFEDLTPGTQYSVGVIFSSQAYKFKVNEYVTASGTPISTEYAKVEEHYGDMGIFTRNIDLEFQLGIPGNGMRLYIGVYSGGAKITVNGTPVYFKLPTDIDGTSIGGVPISVIDLGDSRWQINLKDVVNSFSLGGPEVWIGDICFGEKIIATGNCVDFESLSRSE